jgi:hypothetical protein
MDNIDMKFIILHETKNDDGIKAFFNDVWELYIKVCAFIFVLFDKCSSVFFLKQTAMNPFHTAHTPIRSTVFDNRVRASAKKHL